MWLGIDGRRLFYRWGVWVRRRSEAGFEREGGDRFLRTQMRCLYGLGEEGVEGVDEEVEGGDEGGLVMWGG